MKQTRDLDVLLPIDHYEEVESTQKIARKAVETGELGDQGRVFVSDRQTRSFGRFGRSWLSPKGGLWCTIAWPVNLDPERVRSGLGLRVGLAVIQALEHILGAHGRGEPVTLKWPNDILIGGKKAGGILCEVLERRGKTFALIGIGINGNFSSDTLPGEIASQATTLLDEIQGHVNLDRLLDDLRARVVDALMTEGLPVKTLAELRMRLHGLGRQTTITLRDGTKQTGELSGLADDGHLLIRTSSGESRVPPGAEVL